VATAMESATATATATATCSANKVCSHHNALSQDCGQNDSTNYPIQASQNSIEPEPSSHHDPLSQTFSDSGFTHGSAEATSIRESYGAVEMLHSPSQEVPHSLGQVARVPGFASRESVQS
jgi:hypothetical protein